MQIRRGNILLVNFEPVIGKEQGKIRPSLVIQNDVGNRVSPLTIVAPITSKIFEKKYPTNVEVNKNKSKLNSDFTILLNQIRTIDKSRAIKKMGSLDYTSMTEVDLAIRISLGLKNINS